MSETQKPTPSHRLLAIDWLRGLVMVLMALDHASMFYNKGRVARDSVLMYKSTALPLAQFLTRWITHLCAPTFVFLAGTAIALSAARRSQRGESPGSFDRYLFTRGAILIGIDLFLFSTISQKLILQVMFALGIGMIAMIPLRRLPTRAAFALALGWFFAGELLTTMIWQPATGPAPMPIAILLGVHLGKAGFVIYPALPWTAIMLLGLAFGKALANLPKQEDMRSWATRTLSLAGSLSLLVFLVVRGLNQYGNFSLYRLDHSLAQWLHVSKYPPGLSFVSLELGLMALILALLLWAEQHISFRQNGLVLVLGQTALFFYIIHFLSLGISIGILGPSAKGGLPTAFLVATIVLAALYFPSRMYRNYKRKHPNGWTRYL